MPNGSPPSSRSYLSGEPILVHARGTLREALGALGNLDQLLGSLRVGPKALSAVLPDVRDSCGPAQSAVDQLLLAARAELGSSEATDELERYFRPRFNELYQAINHAISTPMHARHRLELERVVTRVTPELEAARALLDLLEEALAAPSIRLRLRDLLGQVSVHDASSGPVVEATVQGDQDSVELLLQPQVAIGLFRLGANLLQQVHRVPPTLRIERSSAGSCTIHFEPGPAEGERLLLRQQTVIAPTLLCLDEAVTHTGCSVQRAADGSRFSVRWG